MNYTPAEYEEYQKKCDELEKDILGIFDTVPSFVHCHLGREEIPNAMDLDGSVILTITIRVIDNIPFKAMRSAIFICINTQREKVIKYVKERIPYYVGEIYKRSVKEEMEKKEK